MSNFKIGNSKFSRFVNGRGFYIALALCLVAIGTAAYVAVRNTNNIVDNIQSGSGASVAENTSSIPNWDAAQANTTVSGVSSDVSSSSSQETSSSSETSSSASSQKLVYTMPVTGSVTTAYSDDNPIYDKTMDDWRVHNGVDLAAKEGTPVKACASGTVIEVKVDDMLGQEIVIDHGNGIKSVYANLSNKVNVKKGQSVNVGDTIGAVGETAQAEIALTPHLHFEMTKAGRQIDPLKQISGDD
jgi:murein DD-endopeptidase MepM/ murein hydrolase activator NlpD